MGFIKFIFSKPFFINLLLVGVLAGVGVVGLFFWMDAYTEHEITVAAPDFTGVSLSEIAAFADTTDIEFEIIDSLYSNKLPRGTVADQEPKPGAMVKRGRKIYLTVNAVLPKQVVLPDLRNLSFRQAKALLETFGLKLGRLEYVPDIAKNAVLDQKIKGVSIKENKMVFYGTVVDLVLGDGLSGTKVPIPYLLYKRLDEATEYIRSASLNLATFRIDTPITDTSLVRVYKQVPAFNEKDLLPMGSSIILYLTEDTLSIDYDSTYQAVTLFDMDSLGVEDEMYDNFENE